MILAETKQVSSLEGQTINEQVFNLLEETKTNWLVNQTRLVSIDGLETKSYGLFRSDDNSWLGTMSDKYTPLQNQTLAQTIVEASSGIGESFRGGTLQKGRKVFYQIALPNYKVANDTIKRWITAINSHDGSTSIGFGSSNEVVICSNTFYKAYKEIDKFRHSLTSGERLEIAKNKLQQVLISDNSLMNSYERMADFKIGLTEKSLFNSVYSKLFQIEGADINPNSISTQKKNTMETFNGVLESELASHGETLWGLFNAVTFFKNHVGIKDDKKMEAIMIGDRGRDMNICFNEIMAHIEKHSPKLVPVS